MLRTSLAPSPAGGSAALVLRRRSAALPSPRRAALAVTKACNMQRIGGTSFVVAEQIKCDQGSNRRSELKHNRIISPRTRVPDLVDAQPAVILGAAGASIAQTRAKFARGQARRARLTPSRRRLHQRQHPHQGQGARHRRRAGERRQEGPDQGGRALCAGRRSAPLPVRPPRPRGGGHRGVRAVVPWRPCDQCVVLASPAGGNKSIDRTTLSCFTLSFSHYLSCFRLTNALAVRLDGGLTYASEAARLRKVSASPLQAPALEGGLNGIDLSGVYTDFPKKVRSVAPDGRERSSLSRC